MKVGLLGDHAEILSGFAFKSSAFNTDGTGMPLIRIRDVMPGKTSTFYDGLYEERFVIQNGEILIGMDGDFNRARWAGGPALLNQRVCKIAAHTDLDDRYLFHLLPQILQVISDRTPFVTVKHLSAKDLRETEIPLPPLAEQRRIAAILDQADALRRLRCRALDRLNTLGQAIFHEMFGDLRTNSFNWKVVRVGDVTDCIVPGRNKPKSFSGCIPWITTAELVHLGRTRGDHAEKGLSELEIKDVGARIIPDKSVIMTCAGDLGVTSMADERMVINQQLHAFQCGPSVLPEYLMRALSHQKEWMLRRATQTTLPYMNKSICNSVPISLPPIEVQREFRRRISEIDAQSALILKFSEKFAALFASLQHRAFQGKV